MNQHPFEGLYDAQGQHLVGTGVPFHEAMRSRPAIRELKTDGVATAGTPVLHYMLSLDGAPIPMGALAWLADAVCRGMSVGVHAADHKSAEDGKTLVEAAVRERIGPVDQTTAAAASSYPTTEEMAQIALTNCHHQQGQIRALTMVVGALMAALQKSGAMTPDWIEAVESFASSGVHLVDASQAPFWGAVLGNLRSDEVRAMGWEAVSLN